LAHAAQAPCAEFTELACHREITVEEPRVDENAALVLFSGGQDSTTCLAWALDRFDRVETIGFDYGQRHRVELDVRGPLREALGSLSSEWARRLGDDHLLDMGLLGEISDTALTRDVGIAMRNDGLPNTFVPGRNLIFLTFAAAVAYRRGAKHLVTGVCETDYSGYPDCRDDTIKAMQLALNLGMATRFVLHTPLMWVDKAGTWRMAEEIGGDALVRLIRDETHTCYEGDHQTLHEWGPGCGACPACNLRAAGYRSYAADRVGSPK
jgi:7-cyano-7-deazaguanine synthase